MLNVKDDGSSNPFPPAVRSDDWIAYHGTSAAYAQKIEVEGLGHGGVPEWFDDARRLFEFCKEIGYYGVSPGGVTTLPFAVSDSEVNSGFKRIYLAESFERACVFATAGGGESVHAIGIALDDLRRFVTSPELLQGHREQLALQTVEVGGDPEVMRDPGRREAAAGSWHPRSDVRKIHRALSLLESAEWLEQRVASFQRLGDLVDAIREQHAPVVYAVRLTPDELMDGEYSHGIGIALHTVPPDRLVARCDLEFERDPSQSPGDDDGLLAFLRWTERFHADPPR